jgi:regulator of CtrA degradation
MSDFSAPASTPWRATVISDFARSELFDRTFQEGMDLVEETAAYLDGGGRQDSKLLSRSAALAYASESMRLTTRLMRVASWLLVQRAVREGDMAPEAACDDRYRVDQEDAYPSDSEALHDLPLSLLHLLDRSGRLYDRVPAPGPPHVRRAVGRGDAQRRPQPDGPPEGRVRGAGGVAEALAPEAPTPLASR